MISKGLVLAIVTCLIGIAALPAAAATLSTPACSVSGLDHQYSYDSFMNITSIRDRAGSDGSGTYTQSGFSANLAGYNQVIVRVEAPSGEWFAYEMPTGASSVQLRVRAEWAAGGDPASYFGTPVITFEGLSGTAPTSSYALHYVSNNGGRVGLEDYLSVSGDFSFTAMQVAFGYSHTVPSVTNSYSPNLFEFSGLASASGSSLADQTLLAVVPEPATLALLTLGGLGVIGRAVRRRRAAQEAL